MPFKSQKQAWWMAINMPDTYKKWKKKYGSPISKKKEDREQKRYDLTQEGVISSHSQLHSNYTVDDFDYYNRMHKVMVKKMAQHSMTHMAEKGHPLDEALPLWLKNRSKWNG
jgi:hypothetical protein